MNCLKCPNYWRTDIDETKCDKCGCDTPKENEETTNDVACCNVCEEGEEGLDFFDPVEDPFNEDDPYVVTNPMAFY